MADEALYYATFDRDGVATGFYNTKLWDPSFIPEGVVELTLAQYELLYNNQGRKVWKDGEVVDKPAPIPPLPGA